MTEPIFPSGRFIPSEDVIDRNGFARELEERLFIGDSTMFTSPRRSGKTTMVNKVLESLRARGCYTVYVDLFYVLSSEELRFRLLQKVLQVHYSESVQDRTETNHFEQAVAQFGEIFEIAEKTAQNDQKRLIIVFDEWQEIVRIGGQTLIKQLRSILQRQHYVTCLFVGSETSKMRTLFADPQQPFYRFATMLNLPVITQKEWREYIHHKLNQAEITIDDEAFEELMNASGAHPFGVTTILHQVDLLLRLNQTDHVDVPLIRQSIQSSLDYLEALYTEMWRMAMNIRGADRVLTALMDGLSPYGIGPDDMIKKALYTLVDTSILTRIRRGQYRFVEPIFQEWIVRKMGK